MFILIFYAGSVVVGSGAAGVSILLFFVLVNFLCPLVIVKLMMVQGVEMAKKIKPTPKDLLNLKTENKSLGDMLGDKSFIMVFLGAIFIIGPATLLDMNTVGIATALGAPDQLLPNKAGFWIADMLGRFIGGLLGYFLTGVMDSQNHLLYALSGVFVFIGYSIALGMIFI